MNILAMLASAGATIGLWAGAAKYSGPVARGYRWLGLGTLFWLIGLIVSGFLAGPLSASGSLSLADVAPLLALSGITVGIMVIGSGASKQSSLAGLADGYVMAVALLVICWVGAFGAEFHSSGEHPGTFLLTLLHPLTDLAVLGAMLPVLMVARRHVLLPYLALLVLTGSDAIGVGARLSGGHEGIAQQLAMVAAACLLAIGPWLETIAARLAPPLPGRRDTSPGRREALAGGRDTPPGRKETSAGRKEASAGRKEALAGRRVTRAVAGAGAAPVIAAVALVAAAFAVIAGGLASGPASGAALVIAGGAAVLVFAVRVLFLVRESGSATRMWRESGTSLLDLAARTSDIVLLCDLRGIIRRANPVASGFTYPEDALIGKSLADFVHPEDLAAGQAAIRRVIDAARPDGETDPAEEAPGEGADSRFACRVRAADGTWRHIQCAVLVYRMP
ncbi:MAG: PAS domain-containing protein, partial [Nocardiopsaceae bacterium]|nr:PAS domain-containing protein [Nocardiopsaceae bacterium]